MMNFKTKSFAKVLGITTVLGVLLYASPAAFSFNDTLNASLWGLRDPYEKVLRKYTREGAIYSIDQIDTLYKWFATLHSPEFLAAFQKRYEELYPVGQNGMASQLKENVGGEHQAQFFIALYAKARDLKRMTGYKNLWDISLQVGDKVFQPVSVEEVALTPFQYRFYPYVDKWYKGYRVTFPYDLASAPGQEMTLQLTSVAGTSRLTFPK